MPSYQILCCYTWHYSRPNRYCCVILLAFVCDLADNEAAITDDRHGRDSLADSGDCRQIII